MAVGYTNLKWQGTMQNHILCPWKQEGKRGHREVKSYLANKIELHVFQCQSRPEDKRNQPPPEYKSLQIHGYELYLAYLTVCDVQV